jgi:hypothetical protein
MQVNDYLKPLTYLRLFGVSFLDVQGLGPGACHRKRLLFLAQIVCRRDMCKTLCNSTRSDRSFRLAMVFECNVRYSKRALVGRRHWCNSPYWHGLSDLRKSAYSARLATMVHPGVVDV